MSGHWQDVDAPATNTAATFSVSSGTVAGQAIRLRALQATIGGTGAGSAVFVVRDGATSTGTVLMQGSIISAANSSAYVDFNNMDVRATSGQMTIETTAGGGANTDITLSAQGDYVQQGAPYLGGI